MDFRVIEPATPRDIELVRDLFVEYQVELDEDLCFQGWTEELRSLPGRYARPGGRLFLALDPDGHPAGCIAVRPLETDGDCEMKRLYVRPAHRRTGLGARLVDLLIQESREAGYHTMKLDSLPRLEAAIRLYESRGFVPTERYNDDPCEETVFLAMNLNSSI